MTEFIEVVVNSGPTANSASVYNNVFVYRAPSLEGNPNSYSAGMIEALTFEQYTVGTFTGSFLDFWVRILSENISIRSMTVRNLYNPSDFETVGFIGIVGQVVSEPLSPTTAVSYRAARERTGRNRWRKRFSGVPEACWNRGVLNPVGNYDAALNEFGVLLESLLTGTDLETERVYTPVVLYNVIETVEGVKTYRRPLTALEAEGLNERVNNVQYSSTLSSQVTRKLAPAYVDADA